MFGHRLHLLYGKNAANALPLIAGGHIVCLQGADSGRQLFKVEASGKGEIYRVLPEQYCECPAFQTLMYKGSGPCVRFETHLCLRSTLGSLPVNCNYAQLAVCR
jgi:predicted nucleic acid-binding Zn finger protein